MKSIKTLFVLIALSAASLAMAEGGAERTLARMEQASKVSMEAYQLAQQEKKQSPVAGNKAHTTDHSNC